ncbi:MAG: aminoglycoside phosphotransferase family protein [Defluviitaleaceae bacterium]|nr:aminoglycoside phosphotransferase family protein [Defluviitaleaceae bacterium]
MNICEKTLAHVVSKMLDTSISKTEYQLSQLHGGTIGNVWLITGTADSSIPFKVVFKITKKWKRYADHDSWRREYDLYESELGNYFTDSLRWPVCYHREITDDENRLWLEHIDGVSGLELTKDMYEAAAYELGRFQGKLYTEQPAALCSIDNLGEVDAMEKFYRHYKSWNVVYDYVRSQESEIPGHLCKMIIDADKKADEYFNHIQSLPIVLCHRDFWVTNIIYSEDKILLIDWDTTGWGYMGEDLASLIADEADVEHMVEYYKKCVPAYVRGFSEYADTVHINNFYVWERILLHFGYRLVEWYLHAETPEDKRQHLDTLEKIYEMKV